MKQGIDFFSKAGLFFLAFCIPALLAMQTIQAHRYTALENQVRGLEKKQTDILENNKKLISDLGLLSSSARIEKIAVEKLGMHQAQSNEIIRVQIGIDGTKKAKTKNGS